MKKNLLFLKSVFLSRLKKTPYKLNFAITRACNSRCLTCNIGRLFRKNPEIIKKELTIQEIATLFENLPSTITWISFSGGEPFLRPDLPKIISLALEKIPNLSVISIPSNGLNTNQIIKKVKKILSFFSPQLFLNFSLDGPPEVHNKIRGIKDAYKKTWKTYLAIKRLAQKNKNLRVNLEITISRLNIDYLSSFCRSLISRGEKITMTVAHQGFLYKNEGEKEDNFSVDKSVLGKIQKVIKVVERDLNLFSPPELVEKLYLRKIPQYIQNPNKQPLPCTALRATCALDSFGRVTPCFMWGEELGSLKKTGGNLLKILKGPKSLKTAVRIRQGKCSCWTPCEAYQSIIWSFLTGRWHRL